ncbi:longitudinals lacking protein-like isoform X1 [Ceratina calcarata]|uniref:Longitudinals lacking protein-like isoform X1 n=2 Tax=Ceratina calcarata TaxID=156304 RepID=A0AAJ7N662_9HYME|nr:longitudinals lacking protein-like isoform X1 [Ceratina calcarata]
MNNMQNYQGMALGCQKRRCKVSSALASSILQPVAPRQPESSKRKRETLENFSSTMADEQQQFFLKWNDFQSNMVSSFKHLRDEKSFTDVTLACDGQTCKAHKMVLSACSPYFKTLLEENPSKHPIIILKDVAYSHLQAILEFMYAGEVNVSQDQLPAFLKTADRLKVKGLAEAPCAMKREG